MPCYSGIFVFSNVKQISLVLPSSISQKMGNNRGYTLYLPHISLDSLHCCIYIMSIFFFHYVEEKEEN